MYNLGDSVDSYKGETVRGHELPTTITPKEQSKMYLDVMLEFFNKLLDYVENSHIKYICIGDSNHWLYLNTICANNKKLLFETRLTAGTPEMVISNQATDLNSVEGSSTIPEMEVESSDSKCLALSIISNTDIDEGEDIVSSHINKEVWGGFINPYKSSELIWTRRTVTGDG